MDNYHSQWRIWAKVVAFSDLIESILALVVTLFFTFMAGAVTTVIASSDFNVTKEAVVGGWLMWLAVAILTIVTTVSMWASIKLINATELGREAKVPYGFCQSWRIVCIVFIVLNVITNLMMELYIKLAIDLLLGGVFLYVVQRYIKELETYILRTQSQMKPTQKV